MGISKVLSISSTAPMGGNDRSPVFGKGLDSWLAFGYGFGLGVWV